MFKKTIPVAVAVILSLSTGAAIADQTFHRSNDEIGTIMHVVPGIKSRSEVAKNDTTADGWRYVGGDTGWELIQHAYAFRNGKLLHIDNIDHSTPKPSLASIVEGRKRYQDQYSGG